MLASSLRFPDRPAWRKAKNYSPAVADALTQAYEHLKWGPTHSRAYCDAYDTIVPWLTARMSKRQQMHAYYVSGKAQSALGETGLAVTDLTHGLELAALYLRDHRAMAQLAHLRAIAYSWQLQYRAAVTDLHDCLAIVRSLRRYATAPTRAFELTVLRNLAGFEFMCSNFDEAREHLQQAQAIPHSSAQDILDRSATHWITALIERWRGSAMDALQQAQIACEGYREANDSRSLGRIQIIIADIALDLALFFPPGDIRDSYITLALPYGQRAAMLAHSSDDLVGADLAQLVQARAAIISRRESSSAQIVQVIRDAERYHDASLEASAYTALGYDFDGQGDIEAARLCFREVAHMVEDTDISALGVWAKRALARYDRDGI
jgi:tetratricopeptide (TPR) repeat protein